MISLTRIGDERDGKDEYSKALVLGKEDFLSLLTSCIICVVKGEESVVEHLLSWGFLHKLCELLQRALNTGKRGTPQTCVVRILHTLVSRVAVVDSLACAPVDVIRLLTDALDVNSSAPDVGQPTHVVELSRESVYVTEVLKKIFQTSMSQCIQDLVAMAMRANLPKFLLDNIIGASNDKLSSVRNPSATRMYAVDTIKAMLLVDSAYLPVLNALLEAHHSWGEYRHQSHDLFITVRPAFPPALLPPPPPPPRIIISRPTSGLPRS